MRVTVPSYFAHEPLDMHNLDWNALVSSKTRELILSRERGK